jgi:hypothetical protein
MAREERARGEIGQDGVKQGVDRSRLYSGGSVRDQFVRKEGRNRRDSRALESRPVVGLARAGQKAVELVGNILSSAGRYHLEHFNGLRSGDLLSFSYAETKGIITFPSFHTIVPVLLLWSVRKTWAFWPAFPVSLIMIFSTLSIGGHHLADIVASITLCAISIWLYAQYVAKPASQARLATPVMATNG